MGKALDQDLYPIKLHDLKLSSKDNYELTKKNEKKDKSERKKPEFTKFLSNNCFLYIVYLLKLVSLELYHIGVISFLFPQIQISISKTFPVRVFLVNKKILI